jgi:hypothetical protein
MTARASFYREVHKGIRSMLLDLVVRSGRVDWTDQLEATTFRQDLQSVFALLSSHAHHESEFITPLLVKYAKPVAEILEGAHHEQETQLDSLLAAAHAIESVRPDAPVKGHAFVVRLSRIVGEMLVHMADEEDVAMAALWEALDDAAIEAVHQQLVASIAPDKMVAFLRWMIPAMNGEERAAMLGDMRAAAPEPVYIAVRGVAREVLSSADDNALEQALAERKPIAVY